MWNAPFLLTSEPFPSVWKTVSDVEPLNRFVYFRKFSFFFFTTFLKNVWTFGTSNERKVMWNVGEKRNITNKIILTKNCSDILSKNSSYIFRCIFGEYAARTQNLLKYLSKRLFTFYSNKLSMYKIKRHLHVSLV